MSTSQRIRRSPAEWQEIITQQRSSGLSQAAFCEQQGLALSTFARWKQRLATQEPAERGGEGTWIELPGTAPGSTGWEIELELGDGVRLRLRRS